MRDCISTSIQPYYLPSVTPVHRRRALTHLYPVVLDSPFVTPVRLYRDLCIHPSTACVSVTSLNRTLPGVNRSLRPSNVLRATKIPTRIVHAQRFLRTSTFHPRVTPIQSFHISTPTHGSGACHIDYRATTRYCRKPYFFTLLNAPSFYLAQPLFSPTLFSYTLIVLFTEEDHQVRTSFICDVLHESNGKFSSSTRVI